VDSTGIRVTYVPRTNSVIDEALSCRSEQRRDLEASDGGVSRSGLTRPKEANTLCREAESWFGFEKMLGHSGEALRVDQTD
jgi:hypothetical protein